MLVGGEAKGDGAKCISDTMDPVEVLSERSLIELASFHGLFLRSVFDRNDARNIVVEPTVLALEDMPKTTMKRPYNRSPTYCSTRSDLAPVHERLAARHRTKTCIVELPDHRDDVGSPSVAVRSRRVIDRTVWTGLLRDQSMYLEFRYTEGVEQAHRRRSCMSSPLSP